LERDFSLNIIADVAGRFDELMLLVKKMPDEEFLFLGDLNDRGKQSKQVIEWVMKNAKCLKSNHGDMFVYAYNRQMRTKYPCANFYDSMDFYRNGGQNTIYSYGETIKDVPEEHIKWLAELPWYHKTEDLFVSHAPWHSNKTLEEACDYHSEDSLMWNRYYMKPRDQFQIHGHNANLYWYGPDHGVPAFGVCIDNSYQKDLIGINWPTKQLYKQEYLP
jgi:serine/threonine protein phosphatase 1